VVQRGGAIAVRERKASVNFRDPLSILLGVGLTGKVPPARFVAIGRLDEHVAVRVDRATDPSGDQGV
jgi:hypothetical protein